MLKKLRKRMRQRNVKYARLAVALGAALTLAGGTPCAWASTEIGPQCSDGSFLGSAITWTGTDSNHYTITSSIYSGAEARNGGTITLTYTDINTIGGQIGLNAHEVISAGGTISLTHGSIRTDGASAYGAYADVHTSTSTITLQDVAITTTGDGAVGLLSNGTASSISMTRGSIITFGNSDILGSAYGAVANYGSIALMDVDITTHGTGDGVLVNNGGTLAMTGGSITTHNAGAVGARIGYSGGTLTLADTAVRSVGTALHAEGDSYGYDTGSITATVHGQNISGDTKLLEMGDYGVINLNAYNGSTLSGLATLSGSGVANMSLSSGATWTNPGDSTLTKLELSSGNVRFSTPSTSTYHGVTVKDLVGSGTFYLNANLSAGTADRVNVTGSASGSYQLVVNNQGGACGIAKVVDIASGATNTATFSGESDTGAYRYKVAQGSALTSTYSGLDGEDYYAYNTYTPSNMSWAAINQATAIHSVWYSEMNDIKKRMGELRLGDGHNDDLWARTYSSEYKISAAGADSYKQVVHGLEIGKDRVKTFSDGKQYTGLLVGTGKATNSFQAGGSGDTASYYFGVYSSWLKNDGSYLDLIGKYNWFDHDFTSPVLGGGSDKASFKNQGLGLSAEIGKRFELGNGVFVQPEAELSAMWSNGASYTTANGLAVDTPSARSLELRLGCTAGKKWQGTDGATRQVYGKVSWVNEYAGDSTVRVDTAAFDSSLKGHQWVTGIGFVEDAKKYQVYLDAEKSWGNTTSKAWGLNAGYRWKF